MTAQPGVNHAKTRVQIELSPAQLEKWHWIMEAGELSTRKELVNQAVALLLWGMQKSIEGKEIGMRDSQSGDFTALSTPAFDNAKTHAEWCARQEAEKTA